MSEMEGYPDSTKETLTKPLSDDAATLYLLCVTSEKKDPNMSPLREEDLLLPTRVVKARVEGMNLPIKFTPCAYIAISALAHNPGAAIVILCDCLSAFESQTVDVSTLTRMYPWGFYKNEVFEEIVDDWMKTGKHKWASVYNVLG